MNQGTSVAHVGPDLSASSCATKGFRERIRGALDPFNLDQGLGLPERLTGTNMVAKEDLVQVSGRNHVTSDR